MEKRLAQCNPIASFCATPSSSIYFQEDHALKGEDDQQRAMLSAELATPRCGFIAARLGLMQYCCSTT
jgi:hypothetical protein